MDYIFEEKNIFIEKLSEDLKADERSGVKELVYYPPGYFEGHPNDEFIRIQYKKSFAWIRTTANSNGANYKEVGAEVYGSGAIGRIYQTSKLEEAAE